MMSYYPAVNVLVQVGVWTQPQLTIKKQKTKTGFYSKNSSPADLNSVLIPLKLKKKNPNQEASVTIGDSKWLNCFQTDSWRLRYTGSEVLALGKGPLLHFVGYVCFVLLDDGQRVSLGVKHPVVKR